MASLVLFRKPLSDETLHQLSVKDSRHLSDRSQTQEQPTRFGALSRWLRGSPTANQLSAIEQGHPRRPSGSDDASPLQQLDEVHIQSLLYCPYLIMQVVLFINILHSSLFRREMKRSKRQSPNQGQKCTWILTKSR